MDVEFTVDNTAALPSACRPDGKTYTVRGTLTVPRSANNAQDEQARSIDLYQHALAAGEDYWHIPADAEGKGTVERMAEHGRTSLSIDRLGYGASDHPDGNATCLSSDVSINHQIVTKLKTGEYSVNGGSATPFDRVTMIGHSIGGYIAEAEAALFDDVDQISLLNWNGFTFTPQELKRFPSAVTRCSSGEAAASGGFELFEPDSSAFLNAATGGDYAPRTREAIRNSQNQTPCGTIRSLPSAIAALAPRLRDITVPVAMFAADGDRDLTMSQDQALLYPNAAQRSFWMQPNAGHYGALAQSSPALLDALAGQLV